MAGRAPESAMRVWLIATTAVLLAASPSPVYSEELKMEHRERDSGIGSCSPEETRQCTNLAEPLLRDPDLVFPDNMADVDRVCRTWRQLVECVGSYTGRCFSQDRRDAFQRGAGGALASVNALCTQSQYQEEYLGHAPCIKATLTLKNHCGMYYDRMVVNTEVPPHSSDRASMCCTHHMFRDCVIRKVKQNCDIPDDEIKGFSRSKGSKWTKEMVRPRSASQFAEQVLDQALSFIMDQCRQYILNSKDCLEHRSIIEKDASKVNKSTEVYVPSTEASIPHATKPAATIPTDYDDWAPEQEGRTQLETAALGKSLDHGRDEVVKVVSGPKFTTVRDRSVGRSRSDMGTARSLGGKVFPEETSDVASWSSAAWADNSKKQDEMTTATSSQAKPSQSTTEPWYPSYYYGNTLEGANQQGLSSSVKIKATGVFLLPIVLYVMSLSYTYP